MEELELQQEQAEQMVAFLKQQLSILNELAAQKQRADEEDEIKNLKLANEGVLLNVLKLKQNLKFYEGQNGVKSIHIPKRELVVAQTNISIATATVEESEKQGKKVKESKKENKKNENKGKSGKGQAAVDDNKPIDASRLHLKVGKIVSAKKHPDADSLYVEEVDLGEEKHRTIVSGLVKHYKLEEMQDRMAIFMCNLKPVKMRGILSEGMIICASTSEKVEILQVPGNAAVGDRVFCEGYSGEADAQLNPKRKIWEQVQPDLHVDTNGIPGYKGGPFTIEGKGTCKAPTMKDCPIK